MKERKKTNPKQIKRKTGKKRKKEKRQQNYGCRCKENSILKRSDEIQNAEVAKDICLATSQLHKGFCIIQQFQF